DILTLAPSSKKMTVAEACTNALFKGIELLSDDSHSGEDKMQGYGKVIYRNWCELLREESRRNAERIECTFPHAFIHYENKLRTKQFFEMCAKVIPRIDKELMSLAVARYDDIIAFAEKIATITHTQDSLPKETLKDKRTEIIDMLRRSCELEELALSYIQKAAANLQK
ncbi:MAG: hypothetical protein K2N36_09335, partial [Ruminiclostridium sp.]|nr:hypothetical protein [Ruminiclostridium sp.]